MSRNKNVPRTVVQEAFEDEARDDYVGGYEPRRNTAGANGDAAKSGLFSIASMGLSSLANPVRWGKKNSDAAPALDFVDNSSSTSSIFVSDSDNSSEERDKIPSPPPPEQPQNSIVRRHLSTTPHSRRKVKRVRSSNKVPVARSPGEFQTLPLSSEGPIDPWEFPPTSQAATQVPQDGEGGDLVISPRYSRDGGNDRFFGNDTGECKVPANATFLASHTTQANMVNREEDVIRLRLLAARISADWKAQDFMAPALARRIRDFQFAQEKRRRKYGDERPWGILGLYDYLAGIRVDVEWAEDAAWRRANGEPYLSWVDFDASKKNGVNRPFFTYLLLFICTVALIVSFALNGWTVEPLDENPMIGPSAMTLIHMGAKDSYLIVHQNEAWRLVSSIILHAGLVHYVINMLALWFVGSAIETSHGFIAAFILFVIPAIGGTILSAIFLPQYITVGASGGIFGLIGACLADIVMNWKLLFSDFVTENGKKHHHAMVVLFLLLDIALNCIIGLTPYVDNFTHLGGMAIGFLCGLSTMERLSSDFFGFEQGCWSRTKQIVVRFLGLIVSVIGIIVATIILLEGDGETTPCTSCTWLSCVPFPPWAGRADKWWYCDDCGRITAEIVESPSLHLELNCPDGTNVAVGLDSSGQVDRNELEQNLPSYCREHCPNVDSRF